MPRPYRQYRRETMKPHRNNRRLIVALSKLRKPATPAPPQGQTGDNWQKFILSLMTEEVDTQSIGSLSTVGASNDAITLPAGYYMLSMEFNATENDTQASDGYRTHIQANVNGAGESSLFYLSL